MGPAQQHLDASVASSGTFGGMERMGSSISTILRENRAGYVLPSKKFGVLVQYCVRASENMSRRSSGQIIYIYILYIYILIYMYLFYGACIRRFFLTCPARVEK